MPQSTATDDAQTKASAATVTAAAQDAADRQKRRKLRLQQRTLLSDCSLMLRYVLDESIKIPEDLTQKIAKVDALLIAANKDPLSDISPDLLKTHAVAVEESDAVDDLLLQVHNALSDLVKPATALSLRETDPEVVWFGMPRIVQWAIYGACVFLIWFLIAVPKPELPKKEDKGAQATASPTPSPTSR